MENKINQIITTADGDKFMILHQAIYNNQNYFVCCSVDAEETDVKEDFYLFEEVKDGEQTYIKIVEDDSMAKFILEHLDLMDEDEN
ncbi:MAG: hypothetical protein IJ565_03850 [Bacilli bacterium]|nr:hypothetical protein [Bacilli bacterium]